MDSGIAGAIPEKHRQQAGQDLIPALYVFCVS